MRCSLSLAGAAAAALLALGTAPAPAAAATPCSTPGQKHTGAAGRSYTTYSFPNVAVGPNGGWKFLPGADKVCGARLHRDLRLPGAPQITVPVYESDIEDPSGVLRVVIGSEAKGRDAWTYWTSFNNAKKKAYGDNAYIASHKQIAVLVPQFFKPADRSDGAAIASDLIFHSSTWADGMNGINPKKLGAESVGSFDVIDALVEYAAAKYPNAQRIVFGGHSMGAQFVHRYSVLRKDSQKRELHYVPMNPGTWLWTVHSRINWNKKAQCPAYDDYKYGISKRAGAAAFPPYAAADIDRLGRVGITERVASRRLHLLVGANDNGAGDYSCEAFSQGTSHRNRGQLYLQSVVQSLPANSAALQRSGGPGALNRSQGPGQAGLPQTWTWDIVPGCTHNEICMFNSPPGQKRLFLDGFPRNGKRALGEDGAGDEESVAIERRARAHAKPHVRAVHNHEQHIAA